MEGQVGVSSQGAGCVYGVGELRWKTGGEGVLVGGRFWLNSPGSILAEGGPGDRLPPGGCRGEGSGQTWKVIGYPGWRFWLNRLGRILAGAG